MFPIGHARVAPSERVLALDAARGVAITLVMLSHFTMRFATETGHDGALRWPVIVGMIASPTFVLLSGAVYGTLSASPRTDRTRLRNVLFDRALFLILVAHALLAGSAILRGVPGAWHRLYITDTIAPALMFGPAIAARTSGRSRVKIAGALMLISWMILSLPTLPGLGLGTIIRELFVGTLAHGGESWWGYHWPLAEWFGLYLIGTAVGEKTATLQRVAGHQSASDWLLRRGLVAAIAGGTLSLIAQAISYSGHARGGTWSNGIQLMSVESKFPPSPAYFLWFGGLGLCVIALMYTESRVRWFDAVRRKAHPLGRSSLMIFVVSDYLFHVPFLFWHPRELGWWLSTFLATLIPLYAMAVVWTRMNGNRLLTVGYPNATLWSGARRAVAFLGVCVDSAVWWTGLRHARQV